MPLLRDVEYFNIDFIYIKLRILQYEVFFHLKIPRFLIVWIYRESFFIRNAIIYILCEIDKILQDLYYL